MDDSQILKRIEASERIPQIPADFGMVLGLLMEPCEYDMDACVRMISTLPELETAMISTLNVSSNLNRVISNLKDAVTYLGAANARYIAIAYVTRLLLPQFGGRAEIFDGRRYWKHCLGTAVACSKIAEETGRADKDRMFTYGLIHDIGVTIIDICLPEEMDKVHVLMEKGIHQIAAERMVFQGLTHAEIGMWLSRKWGLPEDITEVIGYHHTPFLAKKRPDEVIIMHLGDSVSTACNERLMGYPSTFIHSERSVEKLQISDTYLRSLEVALPGRVEQLYRLISF